jgi:galactonate dehydratase
MHLAASIPNFFILEQMEPQRAFRDQASSVPIRFENGNFLLPEGPGLGIEPNLDVLQDHAFRAQPRTERAGSLYR